MSHQNPHPTLNPSRPQHMGLRKSLVDAAMEMYAEEEASSQARISLHPAEEEKKDEKKKTKFKADASSPAKNVVSTPAYQEKRMGAPTEEQTTPAQVPTRGTLSATLNPLYVLTETSRKKTPPQSPAEGKRKNAPPLLLVEKRLKVTPQPPNEGKEKKTSPQTPAEERQTKVLPQLLAEEEPALCLEHNEGDANKASEKPASKSADEWAKALEGQCSFLQDVAQFVRNFSGREQTKKDKEAELARCREELEDATKQIANLTHNGLKMLEDLSEHRLLVIQLRSELILNSITADLQANAKDLEELASKAQREASTTRAELDRTRADLINAQMETTLAKVDLARVRTEIISVKQEMAHLKAENGRLAAERESFYILKGLLEGHPHFATYMPPVAGKTREETTELPENAVKEEPIEDFPLARPTDPTEMGL